jgi:formamidopyrimidine-DNA glycosylase
VGDGDALIVTGMLTGRLRLVGAAAKRASRTCFTLSLSDGHYLLHVDHRYMGRVYLERVAYLDRFALFVDAGPDALDPDLTAARFMELPSLRSGQVKNVQINQKFIAAAASLRR